MINFKKILALLLLAISTCMYAQLPLASPSVSGKVVTPALNSTTGTQGGGLWVNVVDKATNLVVAKVSVGSTGDFTIPTGNLVETYNYDFILSKNEGTVGSPAPAKELNVGWIIVEEGISSTTPDGVANSIFNWTAGAANLTGVRFAIKTNPCSIGTDSDGDGIADECDLDDDNDGITDCDENLLGANASVSNVSSFVTAGNAIATSNNEVRLTPDTKNQAGRMWSVGKVDFTKSFVLRFDAYLGTHDGADGIAAVFHNSPQGVNATGANGLGIGARGIANGIALELDTYNNGAGLGDMPSDHGQIWDSDNQSSTGFLTTAIALPELENGNWHPVVINWNATTKTISYTVDGTNAGTYTGDLVTNYFAGANKVYFGYTASTGGSTNEQKIRINSFCSDLPLEMDSDNDGIPNQLDTDSDGDGCPDAIEGGDNITQTMLNGSNAIGSNISGTLNSPAIATVDAYGVPVITNTGSTFNVDGQAQGQTVNQAYTVNPAVVAGTASSNQTIVSGTSPLAITLTGSTGTIQWQSSTDNVTFANISGATSASYSPGTMTSTTYYRAVVSSLGGCSVNTNSVVITVFSNTDSDGDGIPDSTDLDDDNDGILDTTEGQCINTSNPSTDGFDSPLVATVNGNNIQSTNPYNGWGAETGGANAFNVIRVNGAGYASGPDNAQSGNQYIDITATSAYVYKNITLTSPAVFSGSAWFANRESSRGGYAPWSTKIEIRNETTGITVAQGNTINFTSSISDEIWNNSSINSVALPAGTYRIRMYVGDFGHLDSISYCFSKDTDNDGTPNYLDLDSDGDGCPDAIEGGDNITQTMLNGSNAIGSNISGTLNSPAIATVDAYGVPVITNTGSTFNVDGQAQGQTVNQAYTVNPAAVVAVSPVTHPTCSVATGSFTITNYNATNTYTFVPAGPTIDASGVVTASTGSYTLTASANGCTSASVSVTVNAQPATPATPTIGSVTQPTCSVANGNFTITNYSSANTYSITSATGTVVSGPTATGLVTTTAGVYTITASANGCTSASVSVTVNAQPATPATPTVGSVIQPTCSVANGTFVITNYSSANTYSITSPTGTVVSGPTATGLVTVTEGVYTITANANGCTSAPVNVTINAQPVTPAVPTVSPVTHPTCSVATGSFTITNYNATNTYTFVPAGPTIDASGVVTASTGSYTLTASANGCTSASVSVTVNAQPATPATPTVGSVIQPTCSVANGTFVITNYSSANTYSITSATGTVVSGPTATGLVTTTAGVYTITASANGCTSAAVNVTVNAQPVTPTTPTIGSVTQPTCSVANGSFTITNYSSANTYSITSPTGTVVSGPTATGLVTVTAGSYTVTSTANGCTSTPVVVVINPLECADIVTVKTDNQTSYVAGQPVTYVITVTNNGPTAATNVNVVDNAPAGTTFTSWSSSNGSGTGNINDTIATLAVGQTVTYTVNVDVPATLLGNLENTVTVTTTTPDPVPGCTTCTDIDTPNTTLAENDINNTFMNIPVSGSVLTNDSDPQGHAQTVTASTTTTPEGTLVLNANGTYTFTPATGFTGTFVHTYTVCDNGTPQACDTATLTIEVLPIVSTTNDVVANNDTATTSVDQPVTINILSNDFDPNGDTIGTPTIVTPPSNGTFDPLTGVYIPNPGFVGVDTFVYQICDDGTPQACDTAVVTITIVPTNITNETYANDDAYNGNGPTITGNILNNDTDPEGNTQFVTSNTQPQHGTVVVNLDGTFVYTPTPGYYGPDSFVYTICDNGTPQACDTATVYLTVNAAPAIVITKDSSLSGNVITYTYLVTNTGNVPLTGVSVLETAANFSGTGTLPNPVYVSSNPSAGSSATSLAVGATSTYTATYTLTQADIDAGQVDNLATASGIDPTGVTVTDDSSDPTPCPSCTPVDPTCTDCTITVIPQLPLISITKDGTLDMGADGIASVGDVITYNFVVTNTGNVTLSNVVVNDPLLGLSAIAVTPGTLLPGAVGTASATYTITQDDIDAGQVDNLAVATGTDPSGNPVSDDSTDPTPCPTCTPLDPTCTDCTIVDINQSPSIVITKDGTLDMGADGIANAGDVITYNFVVTNTGNVTLSNVVVNDPLLGLSAIAVTPGTLLPGAVGTASATYTITQDDIDAGQVDNLAVATGTDPSGNPVTDDSTDPTPCPTCTPLDPTCTDCTIVDINQSPSIVITKDGTLDMGADGIANAGDVITYNFVVTNTGNVTLSNVVVNDPLLGLSAIAVTPGTLLPGAVGTASATYTITQDDIDAGQVDNLAVATGTDPSGNPVSDDSTDPTPCPTCTPLDPTCTDCTIVEIEQQPSIAIVKEATFNDNNGDGFPQAGETITYTFTVTNTGNMSLFDVIVTDPLPGIVLTGGPIDLAVGQSDSTTFTATYTITQADIVFGSVVNQATASAETIDGEVVDDLSDDDSELEDDPTIVILEDCKLTIFNAVSPNGDGSNDIFYIQGIECYPNNTVEVYNRWGIKVYEVNNYDNISNVFKGYSDGRVTISRNELLPTGTYFYIIKYVDLNGNGIDKSGYLYIQSN